MRKEISWSPDQTVGEDNLNCYYWDIGYYGDLASAQYHFDIKYVMGTQYPSNPLDVNPVIVAW